jgi:CelD/BcsL family acetyltransferase involved in cellulose biosynthesis
MHPLAELQRLLTPPRVQVSGRVVAVVGNKVSVATAHGVVIATRTDITDYRPGDRALLNGKELAGKSMNEGNLPVFFV